MWIGGVRVIIFDERDRLLMVRQRHEQRDIWMLPGGGIEDGETSTEAAVREVSEETGLDIEPGRLIWHIEEVSEERGQRFVNFFMADICGGELKLGRDPEFDDEGQILCETGFKTREEVAGLDNVYPEALRDELWVLVGSEYYGHDPFKLREPLVRRTFK